MIEALSLPASPLKHSKLDLSSDTDMNSALASLMQDFVPLTNTEGYSNTFKNDPV